jgi:2-phosphoglycerate kinase
MVSTRGPGSDLTAGPTVVLIGGAPGSGKTTLGRAIAARLGFGSLTGDDLATAARVVTTPTSHPDLHLTGGEDHRTYFNDTPPEKLIRDAEAQERAMVPVIDAVVRSHLGSLAPVVIDWWLLAPAQEVVHRRGVASIWLYTDPAHLWSRERKNTAFTAGSSDPEKMLSSFMERSLWRNELIREAAEERSLPVLTVDEDSEPELEDQALGLLG